jgi:RNA polymerase sigma-70 factor (ECF subfamily)
MSAHDFTDPPQFARMLAQAREGSADALGRQQQVLAAVHQHAADRKLAPELRQKVSASDLVQETFLEAQRDFGRFQGQRAEEWLAWLCQILLHNLANAARRYRAAEMRAVDREVSLDHPPGQAPLGDVCCDTPAPGDRAAAREEAAELRSALDRLPENYRRVLHLCYQENRTFAQIGASLDCSPEAARKLWARAVARLQKLLESPHESP